MSTKDLPAAYNASDTEDGIYKKWEESGYFNPDNLPKIHKEPFSVSMPPPNVTGVLHLGHALENALMDVQIRYQRMCGKKALLLPGTDHAAVATQARVEKMLVEKEGIKDPRKELGREKLLARIREYAENSKATILEQIKKLGTSCDWSRLAYTFDEKRSLAVNTMFKKMYDDELIYRGHRTVNWSVKGQSTCSDDELVYVERDAKLYTFRYSKDFPIAVATTRPETKLGDTAIAVNPKDKRYKKYIGKTLEADIGAKAPLRLKIIADDAIDQTFGTGAVGVTPAHSMVDFELAQKHKAELIQVIGQDGKMTETAGRAYAGLSAAEAREKLVTWLKENGLFVKEEDIKQNITTSDRFGDVTEVIPMTQWFVDVNKKIPRRGKSLKDLLREAVEKGHNKDQKQKIKITPDRFNKTYFHWIDNLRDWCISRQIWWGHRVPVFYRKREVSNFQFPIFNYEKNDIYVGENPPNDGSEWIQDEDTLDTWFSSGLWTFSTLGWPFDYAQGKPNKTDDLKTYHPTSWMQMGYEILFFWMARMILMSCYALDEIPFKKVYIHGILRDKQGQKFSKSMGTGIDPIDIIEKYGADALRLSLLVGVSPGNDARFYEEKVIGARNFVNKLWNISRFIITTTYADKTEKSLANNVQNDTQPDISTSDVPNIDQSRTNVRTSDVDVLNNAPSTKKSGKIPTPKTIADKWILRELNNAVKTTTEHFEKDEFSQAAEKLQAFTWDSFADWYLEIAKIEKEKDEILLYVLDNLLKLWHPFIPFVTEHIYSILHPDKMLMIAKWPEKEQEHIMTFAQTFGRPMKKSGSKKEYFDFSKSEQDFFDSLIAAIKSIRAIKADYNIAAQKNMSVLLQATNADAEALFGKHSEIIKRLASCAQVNAEHGQKDIPKSVRMVISPVVELVIPLEGIIDFEKETARLTKEKELALKAWEATRARIENKTFTDRAPKEVAESETTKYRELGEKIQKLNEQLKTLKQ